MRWVLKILKQANTHFHDTLLFAHIVLSLAAKNSAKNQHLRF